MTLPQSAPDLFGSIDLTETPPFHEDAARLGSALMDSATLQIVGQIAREDNYLTRVDQLCALFRDLETQDAAAFFIAASKMAVRKEKSGLRALFAAFNVKPPGVEVLRQLETLSSLERASLRLAAGTWKEPEGDNSAAAAFPILDVLEEAGRVGILPPGAVTLPSEPRPIRTLCAHIRKFMGLLATKLGNGERLPEPIIQFLVQVCMLELTLMEKRISHLAETVDPYDMRGMGRLMPVLSRYDQDIDHMKTVVSRLTTYRPFFERMLTLENAITENEMDRLGKVLKTHPLGASVGEVVGAVRNNPVLDRQLFFLVSSVHQISTLRALHLPEHRGSTWRGQHASGTRRPLRPHRSPPRGGSSLRPRPPPSGGSSLRPRPHLPEHRGSTRRSQHASGTRRPLRPHRSPPRGGSPLRPPHLPEHRGSTRRASPPAREAGSVRS